VSDFFLFSGVSEVVSTQYILPTRLLLTHQFEDTIIKQNLVYFMNCIAALRDLAWAAAAAAVAHGWLFKWIDRNQIIISNCKLHSKPKNLGL
jgi:hypothetical protein